MNDLVLSEIISTLNDYEDIPKLNQSQCEKNIFSRWALGEIFNLVSDHPLTAASDTIEKFAWKLKVYAATAITVEQKRIFSIASETAYDLLEKISDQNDIL